MNQTQASNTKLPAPTREQLLMAWRHMRRPGWPATLDEALQLHHYRICITGLARRMGRPGWTPSSLPLQLMSAGAPVPPTPRSPPVVARQRLKLLTPDELAQRNAAGIGVWSRTKPAGWLDVKKLAANDTED